jgi:predicted ATP-grasp superfamily ATP-dependent carboligase
MAHLTFDECRLPEPTMPDTPHPSPDDSSPEAVSGAPLPMSIPGVVILGGAHGTLALARSLGRKGVPVWLVSNDTPLPTWSRRLAGHREWAGPDSGGALGFLLDLAATQNLKGALLVPGGDGEIRFASQAIDQLSASYRVMLPPWERLKWLCEKPLLYRRAEELGVDIPLTYRFGTPEEAAAADMRFPVVLKPNMGGGDNRFSRAKVVRADDRAGFLAAYRDAAGQIGLDNVVVQQLIPGGGACQFSYAALWHDGRPVAEFTARRTRQYPVDFGYTSSFVEVAEAPGVVEASRKLLTSVAHHGLVEIEFKRDPRDGELKLFDVNPRCWSWFGLAAASGVDLGALLWETANGRAAAPPAARTGAAWMYLARDMVAAGTLAARGQLGLRDYLRSFSAVRSWATFAGDDPMPGLIDVPLTAWRVLTRRILR